MRGRTYASPVAGGYTNNHARFQEQKGIWGQKALAVGNLKDTVAIKVRMGRIKPGQSRITQIAVSI